jgi:hypothetical protein
LPAWVARTLPVAVMVNRFLQDDLVFILGILLSFRKHQNRHGMPSNDAGRFETRAAL